MIVRNGAAHREEVADMLTALAVEAVEQHRVFDWRLIYERANQPPGSRLTHAVVLEYSPLPPKLGDVGAGQSFALPWILPLTGTEAQYGGTKGTSRLMFLLRWSDVDIFDLGRASVQVPEGITAESFVARGDSDDADDMCDHIVAVIEGEPDRGRVIDALLSVMSSANEQVRQCAIEGFEALARSEPEAFSVAQADALEALLVKGIGAHAGAREDALRAVRHARQHITSP